MAITYPYTVPAAEAFMGKARTYSVQTNFRQYAVRLRALVGNPRNPAESGVIGVDWAVDNPSAIVEEGSNSNGGYKIYANSMRDIELAGRNHGSGGVANYNVSSPIDFNKDTVLKFLPFLVDKSNYSHRSAGPHVSVFMHSFSGITFTESILTSGIPVTAAVVVAVTFTADSAY